MSNRSIFDASVIIPVYNQKESLRITLQYFCYQQYSPDKFEIIIIDDGSEDGLMQDIQDSTWPRPKCEIRYLSQKNQGRSSARNRGVSEARSRRLIFCDADRFPDPYFIGLHIEKGAMDDNTALIGCPWDYFGHVKPLIETPDGNFNKIIKFSRKPLYYLKTQNLFNDKGKSDSCISWAFFLVGNSSISMKAFDKIGGFDGDFRTWGFEHFEFAIRLQETGVTFDSCPDISNFHIPHPRGDGYYKSAIEDSIRLLQLKHPKHDFEIFKKYFLGEASLQDFEKYFCGTLSKQLESYSPIYFTTK